MQKKLIEEEKKNNNKNKKDTIEEDEKKGEKKEAKIFISSEEEEDEDPVIKKKKEKKRKEKENKEREKFWRVGVICNGQIYELTKHILEILTKIGYEWKTVESNYEFKCRKKQKQSKNKNAPTIVPLHVRLRIFSYCGDDPTENKENHDYLIDLSKICGSIMEFLEFSRELISSMQQAGIVVFKYQ